MGSRLRVEDAHKTQHGIFPRLFDQTIRSKKFLRGVKDASLASLLRGVEGAQEGWAPGELMLRALEVLEAEVRARVAAQPSGIEHADTVIIETAAGERVWHALVRTGFDDVGIPWERYTPETKTPVYPYDCNRTWTRLSMDDAKPDVVRSLGPIAVQADGAISTTMHVETSDHRGTHYAKRETKGRLRFVRPWEHPNWRALLASVAQHAHENFRFTDW